MSRHDHVPEDDAVIGRALRLSAIAIAAVAVVVGATLWLLRDDPEAEMIVERGRLTVPAPLDQSKPERPTVEFTRINAESGVGFVHTNGAYGQKLLPETMGGGVAFFDLDLDGDQDLLFVNSDRWPERREAEGPTSALYRNDGSGRFQDIGRAAGLTANFYGQGVAVGDYDGDGDPDLFMTVLGANLLYENDGGRFRDVTSRAGVAGAGDEWSTSAGFFDYDNDGDLDLFVCNYVRWSRDIDLELSFTLNGEDRAYGPPNQYEGTHSYLYRNEGDGTFEDVSAEAGIEVVNPSTGKPMGKALAVTFVDADRDGFLDIFVANDTVQNFVFRNVGGERFEEIGGASGIGFDNAGKATGAMGIDAADLVDDGVLGIGIANFANEHTSLYAQQDRPWQFVDVANGSGIGSPSRLKLSFGLFFFDYDLDGRLDLFQANGHLEDEINQIHASQHYRQAAQLFWNCSGGGRVCFAGVPEDELGDLAERIVGRGAAFADIDGDGDLDLAVGQNGGPPLLVRNEQSLGRHWLRVAVDTIGAEIELTAGGETQRRAVMPTRSYLSQVELPVTFGLGTIDKVESLVVRWPGGGRTDVAVNEVDATIVVARPAGARTASHM